LAVQLILWTAAPFMLFTPTANEWFKTHRRPSNAEWRPGSLQN
jgi:hypothetical protein